MRDTYSQEELYDSQDIDVIDYKDQIELFKLNVETLNSQWIEWREFISLIKKGKIKMNLVEKDSLRRLEYIVGLEPNHNDFYQALRKIKLEVMKEKNTMLLLNTSFPLDVLENIFYKYKRGLDKEHSQKEKGYSR